ncbi:MAG: sulfite exporter TauE/SafE family protein [Candidatus Promineifilaceae bacterium]|nr:sulfite exporter TauE/SafE family protein [Candidatus Promineifilaceae bacterium]
MQTLTVILTLLAGIFAGILTGLMGSSGVMVIVPAMTLLGYRVHEAVAISLAVDMVASVVVTVTYFRHDQVNLRQGLWVALAAVGGAQIGSRLSVYIPEFGLGSGYGVLLFISAVPFWRRGTRREKPEIREDAAYIQWLKQHPLFTSIFLGLSIGAAAGVFGVGGGILFLFALLIIGYDLHKAIGTSTLIMALATASGAAGHALIGNLPYSAAALATVGTIGGGFAAAWVANHLSERRLGKLIAVVFVFLGIAMFVAPLLR